MRFKKMGTRILAVVLPVIILAMAVLTVISGTTSKTLIDQEIGNYMSSELKAQDKGINGYLTGIRTSAETIATVIGNTYKTVKMDHYENMLADIIQDNDMALGSGIWFEPKIYDHSETYMGPYVYKDGDKITTTYEYSNAEYDYFNQDYYVKAKEAGATVITDPYYDPTSGFIMSSCSTPIVDTDGKFIGCVTVDMELSKIDELITSIKVGQGGSAMLLTGSGIFISCGDAEKVKTENNITEDENASLASAGKEILANTTGITRYQAEGANYNLYYDTIAGVGWKLAIQVPTAELNQPINKMVTILLLIGIIALVVTIFAVVFQISLVSRKLKKVQQFALALSEGDFTVAALKVNSVDELGQMGNSLNEMYDSNKTVITDISVKAKHIYDSSEELEQAAEKLHKQFTTIESHINEVNEDMMTTSAATEEVNASAEEVNAAAALLAEQTDQSKLMSGEIKERAGKIGADSRISYENAIQLSKQCQQSLITSMENAKVVENIGTLAEIISGIAEQINLLSLNASIEAARAGEQGRGFAVVALEIGKLAKETASAVSEIQNTIQEVDAAFEGLNEGSKTILNFIDETVTPDYDKFVGIADQYGKDAESIEATAESISQMAENISNIMREVSEAIQNVAETSQNTSDRSADILQAVDDMSGVVGNVTTISEEHGTIAGELEQVVEQFKLDK